MILKTIFRFQFLDWAIDALFKPFTTALKSFDIFVGSVVKGMHFDIIKDINHPFFYYDCTITHFENLPKDEMTGRIHSCDSVVFDYLYQINTDSFSVQALVMSLYKEKFEELLKLYGGTGSFEKIDGNGGYYFSGPAGPFLSALRDLTQCLEKISLGFNRGTISEFFELVKDAN